jgi:hypothetical protein
MATYVNNLRLTEIGDGEQSGTWGVTTNTNLELIGQALGYGAATCFPTDGNDSCEVSDGVSDTKRCFYLKVSSTATLTATRELILVGSGASGNTMSRVQIIENATTGGQSIKVVQVASGTGVTIPSGEAKMVYLNGAGGSAAVYDALALIQSNVTKTGTGTYVSLADDVITVDLVDISDNTNDITGRLNVANQPLHIYAGVQSLGTTNGNTISLNWANGNVATVQNDGNTSTTWSTPSNPVTGGNYVIMMEAISGAVTSFTWPSEFKWRNNAPPTLTTTTNYSDVITLIYDGSQYLASYTIGHPTT